MSACWRSDFRIKNKKNVTEFFEGNAFSGEFYFTDGERDYCFEKYNDKEGSLSWRYVSERGDIFSPYLQMSANEARLAVWYNRKTINSFLKGG